MKYLWLPGFLVCLPFVALYVVAALVKSWREKA